MIVYLDASVLVALLTNDALSDRADALLRSLRPRLLISDFAAAEFASALARRVRTGALTADEARITFSTSMPGPPGSRSASPPPVPMCARRRRICAGSTCPCARRMR